jgi:hypothetical protein
LHDCEDFPLPKWSGAYCGAFTEAIRTRRAVPAPLIERITNPHHEQVRTVLAPGMRQEVRVTLPVAQSVARYPSAQVVIGRSAAVRKPTPQHRPMFGPLTVRQGQSMPKRLPRLDALPSEHPCKVNGARSAYLNLCLGRSPEGHLFAAQIR